MLNMKNSRDGLRVENLEEISFTREREILVSTISNTFRSLEPSEILKKHVERILNSHKKYRKIFVIGFGKACLSMYSGVRDITSSIAEYSGILIPEGEHYNNQFPELEVFYGTHPLTSELSEKSTRGLLENLRGHNSEDLIIVLISGGGSALFELPLPDIAMEDLGRISECLMKNGADIRELNIIRQSMSQVKGGKLASLLSPSHVEGLVVSDVPGDDLQLIASGPLTPPTYNNKDFEHVVKKYSSSCPDIQKLRFSSEDSLESLNFSDIHTEVVLKNRDFVQSIENHLSNLGETAFSILDPITGDVGDVSRLLCEKARDLFSERQRPVWIVAGGETTVKVKGEGRGGRNCELSLRVAMEMNSSEEFMFSSVGTDGIDGVSPAMGGITDSWFVENTTGNEIIHSLENSDSYTLLKRKNSAIITGYTGTNVSDIFILYYNGFQNKKE